MKRVLLFASVGLFCLTLNSCAKKETAEETVGLSQDVLDKIEHLGFNSNDAFAADGGYIVEGCIFLTDENLNNHTCEVFNNLIVGNEEQYRTTNLVTGLPRTITISSSGSVNANVDASINAAIGRYNAENLQLTFVRVPSGGNINIKIVNGGNYIASAGFPSGGNPYPEVKFNKSYQGYSEGFVTTVIAHEVGHCIGFRHTDYMNRAYSCGGAASNEGASTVGAILIPGTPSGPDAASFMLACLGATTNRPFNANDKVALNYLY